MGQTAPDNPVAAAGHSNTPAASMLSRTVRFCINPDGSADGPNGFGGRPAMRGLGRYYELTCTLRGNPDPQTGYIVGIQEIDSAVRKSLIPFIADACRTSPHTEPAALLPSLWELAEAAFAHPLQRLSWSLTPTYRVEMTMTDRLASPPRVLIRQKFDFAAAHRLHSPELSAEENRATFGKCNNPSGHGHNYQIEPAVALPVALADGFSLASLEQIVEDHVIDVFDHKHLNTDTPDFDPARGGMIPSVEHIAMVCFDRLAEPVRQLGEGAELLRITVWETDRTSCTYPA